jgi:hypothetical protein
MHNPTSRLIPATPREVLQLVFGVCICVLAGGALWHLIWGEEYYTEIYLGASYSCTLIFAFVYVAYARNSRGETKPDSGRKPWAARKALRLMTLICTGVLVIWTGQRICTGEVSNFIVPLCAIFGSIFICGKLIHWFEEMPVEQDCGYMS